MKNEHEERLRKLLLEAVELMANHLPYGQFTEFAEKVNEALKRQEKGEIGTERPHRKAQ